MEWNIFPRYWPFVRGIHWSSGNSLHKGQWRGALMFSLICAWTSSSANHGDAGGNLRRHRAHYDIIVMCHPPHHRHTFLIMISSTFVCLLFLEALAWRLANRSFVSQSRNNFKIINYRQYYSCSHLPYDNEINFIWLWFTGTSGQHDIYVQENPLDRWIVIFDYECQGATIQGDFGDPYHDLLSSYMGIH